MEAYKRIFLVNTYFSTLPGYLEVCWIWLHVFMQALANSIRNAQYFLLRSTWVCLLVMRIYCLECIDKVWWESPIHTLYLWVYYLWMLPEWTIVCYLTAHDLKELQSLLEVWGYHPRRRKILFPFRWGSRYAEITSKPTSGKRQWYAGSAELLR